MADVAIDWRTRSEFWGATAAARSVTMDDGGGAQTLEIDERSAREALDAIATWGAATFGGSWSWTWSDAGVITLAAGVAVSATWGSALQDRLGMPASHVSGTTLAGSSRPPAFYSAPNGEIGAAQAFRAELSGDASGNGAALGGTYGTQSSAPVVAAIVDADDRAAIESEAREAPPQRVGAYYADGAWTDAAIGEIQIEHAAPLLSRVTWEVVTDA